MPLAAEAVSALTANGLTLATAEATTGGLIGHLLTGAGPDRPAGLFWIALAQAGGVRSERFLFEGDRSENRRACAEAALRMLLAGLSGA